MWILDLILAGKTFLETSWKLIQLIIGVVILIGFFYFADLFLSNTPFEHRLMLLIGFFGTFFIGLPTLIDIIFTDKYENLLT